MNFGEKKNEIIITVVEKLFSEAHIDIPNGLTEEGIKQYIVDLYNNGEIQFDMNIYQVDFESISAQIIQPQQQSEVAA